MENTFVPLYREHISTESTFDGEHISSKRAHSVEKHIPLRTHSTANTFLIESTNQSMPNAVRKKEEE